MPLWKAVWSQLGMCYVLIIGINALVYGAPLVADAVTALVYGSPPASTGKWFNY